MNTFALVLNPAQQSPSVQAWLLAHDANDFSEGSPDDGIVTSSYQTEDHVFLEKVAFSVKDMTVRSMSSHMIFGMLYNRFNWSADRAERFQQDFGQLLEIKLPGIGSIYYAQVLDIDACEIRIDFK